MDVYDTPTSPNPGVAAYDPLYPAIVGAESMKVASGQADWSGTYGDYQTSGIALKSVVASPNGFPLFNATSGCISSTYTPNVTSLGVGFYHIATELRGTFNHQAMVVGVRTQTPPHTINLVIQGWTTTYDQDILFPFVAGTPYTFDLSWQCGTVVGDFNDVLADGWVKLSINGVEVFSVTNFAVYIDWRTNNELREIWFGYYGLLGALDNILLYATPTIVNIPAQWQLHRFEINPRVEEQS